MEFYYRCHDCGEKYSLKPEHMLCKKCKQTENKPLRGILEVLTKDRLPSDYDILSFLPVEKTYFPSSPVGNTLLWRPEILRRKLNLKRLYIKDESGNPTFSLKDRASFLVAAYAIKHNIHEIVLASTGNAGSSMSGIGAAAGLKIHLFLPQNVPEAKLAQSLQYGASIYLVNGNYDKAYELSMEFAKKKKIMSRNTAFNPLTIEGKKTVGLEIYFQIRKKVPDLIYIPVGDGVIFSGVAKAFKDLRRQGLISKLPQLISVQSEGSNAINRAFQSGDFDYLSSTTIADSISVDIPKAGYLALKILNEFKGRTVTVSDDEILNAQKELAKNSGLFTEPAGACAFAGLLKDHASKKIDPDQRIVVLTTGSGLKDVSSALKKVRIPNNYVNTINEIV